MKTYLLLVLFSIISVYSCHSESDILSEVDKKTMLIPAGSFIMGNTGGFDSLQEAKLPNTDITTRLVFNSIKNVHPVVLTDEFYMSKYEVTQELYEEVMGKDKNLSYFRGEKLPVESIAWIDAIEFCNELSKKKHLQECYILLGANTICDWEADGYRLPTSAEWEYACRAGTITDNYLGNLDTNNPDIDKRLDEYEWYRNNSKMITHPVGTKKPNQFGLFDMLGNVNEWVWDKMDASYTKETATNPIGNDTAFNGGHVIRGGAFAMKAHICRSALRIASNAILQENSCFTGFRIVRNKSKEKK